jgi:gluconokinase
MAQTFPTIIPGLRSPFDQVGGIVYFGRMLDKMRLAAAGKLPAGWQPTRGTAMKTNLDSRCCSFLRVDYAALEKETLKGETMDDELLARPFKNGRQPSEDEIEVWNGFMTKLGWRDAVTERVNLRLAEIGLPPGSVQTMFDFIDLDEGRLKLVKQ